MNHTDKARKIVDALLGEAFRLERPETWLKDAENLDELRSGDKVFDVNGHSYRIRFDANNKDRSVSVKFRPENLPENPNVNGLTKRNHPMAVLSVVAHSIADYARTFHPKYLKFRGEGGRESVYDKMISYQKNFNVKIKRLTVDPITHETLSSNDFVIEFDWN